MSVLLAGYELKGGCIGSDLPDCTIEINTEWVITTSSSSSSSSNSCC